MDRLVNSYQPLCKGSVDFRGALRLGVHKVALLDLYIASKMISPSRKAVTCVVSSLKKAA